MRLVWAIAVAVLLAGCTTSAPHAPGPAALPPLPSGLPSTLPPGTDLFSLKPEMIGCHDHILGFEVPRQEVQDQLPSGFISTGWLEPATATVQVRIFDCATLIVDNATLVPNFRAAFISTFVLADQTISGEAAVQSYLWETYANAGSVARLFQEVGFNAREAEITIAMENGMPAMTVTADGKLVFSAQGGSGAGLTAEVSDMQRMHHRGPLGNVATDWLENYEYHQLPTPAHVEAESGILASFTTQGKLAGLGDINAQSLSLSFIRPAEL